LNGVATILETAARRITALDASAWSQAGQATPAWVQAKTPLRLDQESSYGHLRFSVYVSSAPADLNGNDRYDRTRLNPQLVVEFLYRLRAFDQSADEIEAWKAQEQVTACMIDDWSLSVNGAPDTALDEVNTRVTDHGSPLLTLDGGWVLMRSTYSLSFDFGG